MRRPAGAVAEIGFVASPGKSHERGLLPPAAFSLLQAHLRLRLPSWGAEVKAKKKPKKKPQTKTYRPTAADLKAKRELDQFEKQAIEEIYHPKAEGGRFTNKPEEASPLSEKWTHDMAQLLEHPTLGSQLVSEWTTILAGDGKGISELLIRLLIAAESASNWQRQVAIVEGKLARAEERLNERYDAEQEAWELYTKRMEQQEAIERSLRAKVRELSDKLDEARRDAVKAKAEAVQ